VNGDLKIAKPPIKSPFTEMIKAATREGMIAGRTQEARNWFRDQAKNINTVSENAIMKEDSTRYRSAVSVGSMYIYYYDPKLKQSLPYYDTFPCIFCVDIGKDYFYGINFHYLPPVYRAKLMDGLYDIINNVRFDETTKLKISYKLLKSAAALKYFKPAFKKYLKAHVRSRFVKIAPELWDFSIFLPMERFERASKYTVWSDSINKINK